MLPRLSLRRSHVKHALAAVATVLAAGLFALLGFELLLRAIGYSAPVWGEPHAQLGWRLRPGIEGRYTAEGDAHFRVNAGGWRDRDHPVDKPADVYRIAVLGDSYAEARQVPADAAFWALLPERLAACGFQPGRRIEALNFSASGYGTAQEYLLLQSAAIRYRPDLVLLQFTNGNDVRNNSFALSEEHDKPFFRFGPDGELRLDASFAVSPEFRKRTSASAELLRVATDHSRLLQMLRAVRERAPWRRAPAESAPGMEQGLEPSALRPPEDALWEDAWQVTEALIRKIHDYAAGRGAQFLVVTVPYAIQVHPDPASRRALAERMRLPDLFYPDRRITEFAARNQIAALALAPLMQPLAESSGTFLHGFANSGMGRGHWNRDGHRVAADLIAQFLCESRRGGTQHAALPGRAAPAFHARRSPEGR